MEVSLPGATRCAMRLGQELGEQTIVQGTSRVPDRGQCRLYTRVGTCLSVHSLGCPLTSYPCSCPGILRAVLPSSQGLSGLLQGQPKGYTHLSLIRSPWHLCVGPSRLGQTAARATPGQCHSNGAGHSQGARQDLSVVLTRLL